MAADRRAFALRYGEGLDLNGVFESGKLDDSGERIRLYSNEEELIHDFRYSPDLFPESDGIGSSIETINNFESRVRITELNVTAREEENGYEIYLRFFILNEEVERQVTFFLERLR